MSLSWQIGPPTPSLSSFVISCNVPITSPAPLVFAKLNSLSLSNLSSDGDRAINLIAEEEGLPWPGLGPGAQHTRERTAEQMMAAPLSRPRYKMQMLLQ